MGELRDAGSARDAAWFDALYRSHYQDVLRYARRRVPLTDADDVVADVFTTVWRRRHEIGDIDRAWLLRTAGNYVLHNYRSAERLARLRHRLGDPQAAPAPTSAAGSGHEDEALVVAMQHLPETDAELLRLVAWEQLRPAELADVLGCTTTAARVRLHRARRRLAALLVQEPARLTVRSEVE